MSDLISRQAAIDELERVGYDFSESGLSGPELEELCEAIGEVEQDMIRRIRRLPSAQQTLYGYDIEHLKLIANVLQKENLPPERVADALMDIGRIVAIVRDEFEESLRKAVEQCRT